jgi:hypothetical protein
VGARGDEPLSGIDESREPAIAVVVVVDDARVSESRRRAVVRRRIGGPPERPPPELASGTESVPRNGVVGIPLPRRVHEKEKREKARVRNLGNRRETRQREKGRKVQIRVFSVTDTIIKNKN